MRSLGRAAAAAARCSPASTSSLNARARVCRLCTHNESTPSLSTRPLPRPQRHARALSSAGARARREDSYRLPSETDEKDLATKVRESMRLVAQPMAIITTPVDGDTGPETGALSHSRHHQQQQEEPLMGLVASSFNVVSMADERGPIVSFNLKLPSRTYAAISACGRFDVSFPWSSEVCHSFLQPPPGRNESPSGAKREKSQAGESKGQHNNNNSGSGGVASRSSASSSSTPHSNHQRQKKQQQHQSAIGHGSDTGDLLRLHRTFAYRCEWLQDSSVAVADHVIMLGRVTDFVLGDLVNPVDVKADQLPINYRDAKFLKLKTLQGDPSFFEFSVREKVL